MALIFNIFNDLEKEEQKDLCLFLGTCEAQNGSNPVEILLKYVANSYDLVVCMSDIQEGILLTELLGLDISALYKEYEVEAAEEGDDIDLDDASDWYLEDYI